LIRIIPNGKDNAYAKKNDKKEKCVVSAKKNPKVTHSDLRF
jgi:hypothetical protein